MGKWKNNEPGQGGEVPGQSPKNANRKPVSGQSQTRAENSHCNNGLRLGDAAVTSGVGNNWNGSGKCVLGEQNREGQRESVHHEELSLDDIANKSTVSRIVVVSNLYFFLPTLDSMHELFGHGSLTISLAFIDKRAYY